MGLAAAGRDPLSLSRGGHTVLDALRGEAASLHGAGDLERTILALRACGVSVRSFPGGDPVARLLRTHGRDGSFGHLANLTAFAVFALRAAGYSPVSTPVRAAGALARAPAGTRRWLRLRNAGRRQRHRRHGRGAAGCCSTPASHGALPKRAVGYPARAQNLDGGYPQKPGGSRTPNPRPGRCRRLALPDATRMA